MAYLTIPAGTTSKLIEFPVYDSSSTIGALLAGLTYNSSGMTAYYDLWGAAGGASVMSLVTMTKGTWTSLGFVPVDGTNMPGVYQLGIPNAALTGAQGVTIYLKGASNMVPVVIQIELTATSNQDSVRGGMTALPNAAAGAVGGLPLAVDTSGRVDVLKVNGTSQTARDLGASVLLSNGTGTGQISLSSGAVLLQATQTGVTIPTVTNLTNAPTAGDLTATMKASVTAAVPSVASIAAGLPTDTSIQADMNTVLNTAYTDATSLNSYSLLDRIRWLCWLIRNQMAITDATGAGVLYNDSGTAVASSWSVTDNATTITRTRVA